MKAYDISQEVFSCKVYPGDPAPSKQTLSSIEKGDLYNLTSFSMCAHNGTHVDAPYHFFENGRSIDELDINSFVGPAYVASHAGDILKDDIIKIVNNARAIDNDCAKRILIRGNAVLTNDAADALVKMNVLLFGNESQTVGPEDAPMTVHKILLGANIVLLEGLRLDNVCDGAYLLCAAPLSLSGSDGAPCRAILIDTK